MGSDEHFSGEDEPPDFLEYPDGGELNRGRWLVRDGDDFAAMNDVMFHNLYEEVTP